MRNYFLVITIIFSFFACQNTEIKKVEKQTIIAESNLNVAVFKGNGAGATSVVETIEALRIDPEINAVALSAKEIQNGGLIDFDVLIIPGGSGSKQLLNLGDVGKTRIRDFVEVQGKGIIGICAGAYMLSSTPDYPNLKLANSIHIDRAHYNRGRGLVEFELNDKGFDIFPELRDHKLFAQYYDGPVLVQSDSIKGNYSELGVYVSDIHPDNFAPKGITPGRTFLLNQSKGKGKVFLVAGHPESTPGMRWMVPRMARWASGSKLISYDKKWIKPEINSKEIIFDKTLRKEEKKNYWLLFSENSENQIEAMKVLHSLRSRPAVRWNIGLLRSVHPKTRALAAKLLMETEYSEAVGDLEQALKTENDQKAKSMIKKSIDFLKK